MRTPFHHPWLCLSLVLSLSPSAGPAEALATIGSETNLTLSSQGSLSLNIGFLGDSFEVWTRVDGEGQGLGICAGLELHNDSLFFVSGPARIQGPLAFLMNPLGSSSLSQSSTDIRLDNSLCSSLSGLGIATASWGVFALGRTAHAEEFAKWEGLLTVAPETEAESAFLGLRSSFSTGRLNWGIIGGIGYLREEGSDSGWSAQALPSGTWAIPACGLILSTGSGRPHLGLALGLSNHPFLGLAPAIRLEAATSYKNFIVQAEAMTRSPSFRSWSREEAPELGRASLDASLNLNFILWGFRASISALHDDVQGIYWFERMWRLRIKDGRAVKAGPLPEAMIEGRIGQGSEGLSASVEISGFKALPSWKLVLDTSCEWVAEQDSAFFVPLEGRFSPVLPSTMTASLGMSVDQTPLRPGLILGGDLSGKFDLALGPGSNAPLEGGLDLRARAALSLDPGYEVAIGLEFADLMILGPTTRWASGAISLEFSLTRSWPPAD